MNRAQTESFIHENFAGIIQDWPWEDTPEYSVLRHADNRKWFALIMTLPYATLAKQNPNRLPLAPNSPESIDAINLKCDPDLVEEVTTHPGILPAYHMNKRYWITILLDGSCDESELKNLIDQSFYLTAKRQKNTLSPSS